MIFLHFFFTGIFFSPKFVPINYYFYFFSSKKRWIVGFFFILSNWIEYFYHLLEMTNDLWKKILRGFLKFFYWKRKLKATINEGEDKNKNFQRVLCSKNVFRFSHSNRSLRSLWEAHLSLLKYRYQILECCCIVNIWRVFANAICKCPHLYALFMTEQNTL